MPSLRLAPVATTRIAVGWISAVSYSNRNLDGGALFYPAFTPAAEARASLRKGSSVRTHLKRRPVGRLWLTASAAAVCFALTLAGFSAANVTVSKSGWQWANPSPQGRTLDSIAFAGSTGYAVGEGGTALGTANAGQSWTGLATGTSAKLESVQALAPSTVIVGGGAGCVTRISENGGQSFKRVFNVAESNCPEPVASFSFLTSRIGFLLLGNGAVERTEDGGETFSRRTSVPGTPSASGGGTFVGSAVHFFDSDNGIAFVSASVGGPSLAYSTPDGGVSWTPVPLPPSPHVTSVYFVDENVGYAVGPETLLRTADGGKTWVSEPIAAHNDLTSISCATATRCVLTVSAGNQLLLTTDGGQTDSVATTSSSLIYAAGYDGSSDIVAVGADGATVLSDDSGATFTNASTDIGGSYSRLRTGPGAILLAPGTQGNFAISGNDGESWRVVATQTSQELRDVGFASAALGYALDTSGGLQLTTNGGASWQTLSPGTARPAEAVLTIGEHVVLLIGPVGVSRAVDGGAFQPLAGRLVSRAHLSDYSVAGPDVFVFGAGTHSLLRSSNEGATWTAVHLPLAHKATRHRHASAGVSIRSVAFTSAQQGFLLDTQGRLWSTTNGGRTWRESLSTGTARGIQLAFPTPQQGFLSVSSFGGDDTDAYVLRTSNGGTTWQPQEISAGHLAYGDLVSPTATDAAALVNLPGSGEGSSASEPLRRLFFDTVTGGELGTAPASAGSAAPGTLTLSTRRTHYTARRLKAAHDSVTVSGTLAGAVGGETIVVSARNLSGGSWREQRVVAGANGGSFSAAWHITRSTVFVAQWSGGDGRSGSGSKALVVSVK